MSAYYRQKWCGQTQPHNPHTWVKPDGVYALNMSCAGHTGMPADESFEARIGRQMLDNAARVASEGDEP